MAYIKGSGRPNGSGDVCCATFPREMWDDTIKDYRFEATKHCYSIKILRGDTDFNYYKQAYCEGFAMPGLAHLSLALAALICAVLAF